MPRLTSAVKRDTSEQQRGPMRSIALPWDAPTTWTAAFAPGKKQCSLHAVHIRQSVLPGAIDPLRPVGSSGRTQNVPRAISWVHLKFNVLE